MEKLEELGIVKRFVAFGGPKRLRKARREDEKIVARLYAYVKRKNYWFHVLGRSRMHCDSFDTSSWGYRLLDSKKRGEKYDLSKVIEFVKRYESL